MTSPLDTPGVLLASVELLLADAARALAGAGGVEWSGRAADAYRGQLAELARGVLRLAHDVADERARLLRAAHLLVDPLLVGAVAVGAVLAGPSSGGPS